MNKTSPHRRETVQVRLRSRVASRSNESRDERKSRGRRRATAQGRECGRVHAQPAVRHADRRPHWRSMLADLTERLFVLTDALSETAEFDPFRGARPRATIGPRWRCEDDD